MYSPLRVYFNNNTFHPTNIGKRHSIAKRIKLFLSNYLTIYRFRRITISSFAYNAIKGRVSLLVLQAREPTTKTAN